MASSTRIFDLRLVRLQVMRDQAGALVRRRRAAQRRGRHRDHDEAAVLHRLELPAQQQGLRAGLPGMRHLLGCRLVIAGQGVEVHVDAGGEHKPVIGLRRAVGERDAARLRIDLGGRLRGDGDAVGRNLVVAELLCGELTQAGDHLVAERAGGEGPVRLDQRDLKLCIEPPQRPCAGRAAEAAADHCNARRGLGQRRTCQCGRCDGSGATDHIPARPMTRDGHARQSGK
ncbi:hypothetical protein ACVINW_007726 [Bradyrhizobium sp. USDA 4461]